MVNTDTADLDSGAAQGPMGTRAGDLTTRSLQGVLVKHWMAQHFTVCSVLPLIQVHVCSGMPHT